MVYGVGSFRGQRPMIATAVQRSSTSTANQRTASLHRYCYRILAVLLATAVYTVFLYSSGGARSYFGGETKQPDKVTSGTGKLSTATETTNGDQNDSGKETKSDEDTKDTKMKSLIARRLQISTWNIAAINNNPFEYWITVKDNPEYEKLMINIENFLENPGDKDVKVPEVFTQSMFDQLDKRLTDTAGWESVRSYWEDDFSKRSIVTEFLKDPLLGSKRLASMPDRITNTINVVDGSAVFRPTVINMYEEDLSTQEIWWKAWEKFMFDTTIKIENRDKTVEETIPYKLLQKIKKSKYPKISEQEEKDSLPLQTMCGAIFDAILVHMMNSLASPDVWQPLKKSMVENLNKKKFPHTLEILENQYSDSDIITLQEVSAAFIEKARSSNILGQKFHIISPEALDTVRDQNSVICLNKATFPSGQYTEISKYVEAQFGDAKVPVASGDILAITTENSSGEPFVIASFHGDTNGLATVPVTDAIVQAMYNDTVPTITSRHKLIFGLDANTYEKGVSGDKQDVSEYAKSFVAQGLTSCWGDVPNPSNYTTYNARTYLQPQLNKACKQSEKREKGDVNPKDFILFPKDSFTVVSTWKDNTGKREYIEDMAFPTLEFPSDHGILSTIIEPLK